MVAVIGAVTVVALMVGVSMTTAYIIVHNDKSSVENNHSAESQEVTSPTSNNKSNTSNPKDPKSETPVASSDNEKYNDTMQQSTPNTQTTATNRSSSSSSSTPTQQNTSTNPSYDTQGRPMCGLWKSVYYTGAYNTGAQLPYGEADYIPWSTFPNETMAPTLITTGLCSSDFKDWTYGAGSNWCKSENGRWEGDQFVGQYKVCKITSFEKKQL